MSPGKGNQFGGLTRGYWSSASPSRFTIVQHAFFDQQCLRNSGIAACLMSLGFRLYFKRDILVSVRGDLLDVFLKKPFSSQSLILGYANERIRVPAAVDFLRSLGEQ
jgi:hypothetical protein